MIVSKSDMWMAVVLSEKKSMGWGFLGSVFRCWRARSRDFRFLRIFVYPEAWGRAVPALQVRAMIGQEWLNVILEILCAGIEYMLCGGRQWH